MKKNDVKVGASYVAKVSGKLTPEAQAIVDLLSYGLADYIYPED